jgi:2-polyprenyl-3-methyl-5-hydroxy-6-metoxy-1,4-benzoquinol methylase
MQNFQAVEAKAGAFHQSLAAITSRHPDLPWYPYRTLMGHLPYIRPIIDEEVDGLFGGGRRFADIGAGDGDLAFYLESLGNSCDIYDYAPTNYNSLRGARAYKAALGSAVNIYDLDLDSQFNLDGGYDLVFLLGILYHLKNPFYVLERLSKATRYTLVSTRITRHFKTGGPDVSEFAAAYLVGPKEMNDDSTNYWIFTSAGLKQIFDRAGWDVIKWFTVGDLKASNAQDAEHDERVYCTLRSRRL